MNHQPRPVAQPTATNHAPAKRKLTPIAGSSSTIRIALLGPRILFGYLAAMNMLYLIAYMFAGLCPPPPATILDLASTSQTMLSGFGQVFAGVRDFAGHWAFFGATPSPLAATGLGAFSLTCSHVLATVSRPTRQRPEIAALLSKHPEADSHTDQIDAVEATDRARQTREDTIAGVHAAVAQLDAEWLAYTMDVTAYYLTKPVLRDRNTPQTAAYQDALYELRERAEGLNERSTASQVQEAVEAADTALQAWAVADDHALTVGVSDRSPTERAALRRLHALIGQLSDQSTPKPMRDTIVEAMAREMDKLTTVPASREHLAALPALAGRNLDAIAGRPADAADR